LEDLVFFQRGFDITQAQQRAGTYPVVSSSGITSFHDEFMAIGPGVVIGRKGTLGSVHYVPDNYWPHDTTLWSKDLRGNHPRFVYYFLKTLNLKRFDVGNSNPTLNRNHIHELAIRIPPLDAQERVAAVLSAYDDLIENNTRRMALLEQSARLLYEEWFVRLRFPGREHTRLTDGAPVGWRHRLGDVVNLKRGYDLPNQDRGEGIVPIVSSSGITGTHNEAKVKGPGVVTGRYGTLGEVFYVEDDFWPLNTALYVHDFKGNHPLLILQLLRHLNFNTQNAAGAVPGVNRNVLHELEVTFPPPAQQKRVAAYFGDFSDQMRCLRAMNEKLRQARDTLLPRLMTGEVTV
jgi:type I restriction enzyme S subunit